MPAGISLDWFVYPEHLGALFASRMICDVAVLVILGLLFTQFGEKHIRFLGIAWALLPAASISWMIWYTQGAFSPYYAGLNLVIIAVSLLMPWTLVEVLMTCTLTLLMFVTAGLVHHWGPPARVEPDRQEVRNLRDRLERELAETADPVIATQKETRIKELNASLAFPWDSFFNNLYFILTTAVITSTASFFLSKLRFQDYRLRHQMSEQNDELAQSYEKLAELDRLKSQFFANVSHELRTPLTLIIAPLQDVLKEGGTGKASLDDTLRIARDNALRLLRLINDLLDLVRLEERDAELSFSHENLGMLVPGVINSASHLAKIKGLKLNVHVPDTELVCRVDSNAIEKVLLNLLTNAVKFTPAGGSIDVELTREGNRAVIEIKDSGIGIAATDLPRIFDRFGQLDSSSTRKYSGVGIGLALSRDLVEAHEGKLTATSELQRGTVMRVELPVGDLAGDVTAPESHDALSDVHRDARRSVVVADDENAVDELPVVGEGDRTLLLVEDEPDMRRFLTSFLSRDYRIVQAADGLKGYELAVRERPTLALLDLMLPGMDGLDLCAKLRETEGLESLKIVLLTARTDEDAKLGALQRGANDFLTKPFSTLEVRTRLKNLMQASELEDRLRSTNRKLETTIRTLRQTEAQLIQSEKINALGTLSAGLLHEINNPLNFTMTAIQIAQGDVPEGNTDLHETLTDIEGGMARIRDIVSDLRSFAYPERAANKTQFDLAKAIEVSLRLAGHELKDCEIEQQVAPGLSVYGAQNQVVQVLINLLTNAAKATSKVKDDRARKILVSACDNNGRARILIRDNGIGIAKEALKNVFDPFYTTGEPGEGMGLGLSICHTIVKNHGSDLRIESEPDHWTEVTFDLPFTSQEQA
ncbi:MAG: ATP-binding protein [Planctomycetota bacterium]